SPSRRRRCRGSACSHCPRAPWTLAPDAWPKSEALWDSGSMRSLYIAGAWTGSASDEAIDVLDPATEQVVDTVPAGAAKDVDSAVEAAAAAFPAWSRRPHGQRVTHLAK